MKPIGGFFELEVPTGAASPHPTALALTSGRACLRHALAAIAPTHARVPFYTCQAMLEPFEALGIPYRFYALDEAMAPLGLGEVGPEELVVYINYFGLLGLEADRLAERLGERLIVDDTQAFFARGHARAWSFNSARKTFGVPDGAYLYAPRPLPAVTARNEHARWNHLLARFEGRQAEGYRAFVAAEAEVTGEVLAISSGAERLLAGIDYPAAARRRRANYALYDEALGASNQLRLPLAPDAVPFCYPYLPRVRLLAARLHARAIFTPTFWPDCLTRGEAGFVRERDWASRLLPLPLDHRYDAADVARVVDTLLELMEAPDDRDPA